MLDYSKHIPLHDIKDGLDRNEFLFFYQPKISFLTGEIVGAEALMRWQKEDNQFIQPSRFIPLSEESGFITLITEKMFNIIIENLKIIEEQCSKDIKIAFNISSHDLKTKRFYYQVEKTIENSLIDLKKLEFELTEATLADMSYNSISIMHDFHNMGISLALDDFGTGYSSLEVLSTFPFSLIKLDKSLIQHIGSDGKASRIVNSNIRMAQRIGLKVVAEGIEDESVYNNLMFSGCHQGQGYFMSRPVPLNEFIALLNSGKKWSGNPIGLIYQAQLDHIQWRKDVLELFYQIRNTNSDNIDNEPLFKELTSNHTTCNLGKWYYSDGKNYNRCKNYILIEKPHIELHKVGAKLLQGVLEDKHDDKLLDLLEQLNSISGVIIKTLQDLENSVHKGLHSGSRCG